MPKTQKGVSQVAEWLRDRVNYDGEECLIWPFSRLRGYGNLKYEGKMTYAHVVMCTLVKGPAPTPEHHAAHSCGRGEDACVHPKHVSWKTPSQNMLDKRIHGRYNTNGSRTKLTPSDVARIRSLKGRKTQDEMARMFGVSRRNIGAVLSGRSWPTGDYSLRGFAIKPYRKQKRIASGQTAIRPTSSE